MKIAILIDNTPHPFVSLLTERAMSIYFEADGYKILLDVGLSAQFAKNADNMGIDISDVDFLVISHGHFTSTGGLTEFLLRNKKAKIFLSSYVKGKKFFHNTPNGKNDVGLDYSIVEKNINRFVFVDNNYKINENIVLVSHIKGPYSMPKANQKFSLSDEKGETIDDFKHEMVVLVNTPKGSVVLSSCSHNGILNILSSCNPFSNPSKMIACVGGTHLIDSSVLLEDDDDLAQIGFAMIHSYPDLKIFTGHCTGFNAQSAFSAILNERFKIFYTGMFLDV